MGCKICKDCLGGPREQSEISKKRADLFESKRKQKELEGTNQKSLDAMKKRAKARADAENSEGGELMEYGRN